MVDDDFGQEVLTATTVRVRSEHGAVTVFGPAVLFPGAARPDGRVGLSLRYESLSLWLWLNKYMSDTFTVDVWSPVPAGGRDTRGRVPWLRVTACHVRWQSNQTAAEGGGGYVAVGTAWWGARSAEVLRYRHVLTLPDGEEPPGGV